MQQEVDWWLAHKSPETLFIALTDGTIVRHPGAKDFEWSETRTTALPPALKGVFVENPLWVDSRWAKGQEHLSTKNPVFQNALAVLAAPLRNLPKEALIGVDVRRHRRVLLTRGGVVGLLLLLVAAVFSAVRTARCEHEAVEGAKFVESWVVAASGAQQMNEGNIEPRSALAIAQIKSTRPVRRRSSSRRSFGGPRRTSLWGRVWKTKRVPDSTGSHSIRRSSCWSLMANGSRQHHTVCWIPWMSPVEPVLIASVARLRHTRDKGKQRGRCIPADAAPGRRVSASVQGWRVNDPRCRRR